LGAGQLFRACWLKYPTHQTPQPTNLPPPLPPKNPKQVCGLRPGDFVHTLGDAHVYSNHVQPLLQQLKNAPRAFPRLVMNPERREIDEFTPDDFGLVGYEPHKSIKMQMAV
jgi:hypothetical protein